MTIDEFSKEVASKMLNQNPDYIAKRINEIITLSLQNQNALNVNQDTATLIGISTTAAVTVAVEVSATTTAAILLSLGILELEDKPSLHIVPPQKD